MANLNLRSLLKNILLFGVLAVVVYLIYAKKMQKDKQAAAQAPPVAAAPGRALNVSGFVVKSKALSNQIDVPGTLLPNEEIEIRPEVSGRIVRLNLNEGVSVSKGALLVKLFDADLKAQLQKLDNQKQLAEKTEERLRQLLAIKGVSQQEYENALNQLNGIKADMEILRVQLTKTEIKAPFSGTLGLKNVSEGAYVTPSNALTTLQQTNPIKLEFSIPERYAPKVRQGSQVSFTVDGQDRTFSARVYAADSKVDLNTRTLKMRATCPNPDGRLSPGSFAKVLFSLKDEQALLVPTQAVIPEARGKKVIVLKQGKASFVPVETGVRQEAYIQLLSGVNAGDTVITTGIMSIRPDASLKVSQIVE